MTERPSFRKPKTPQSYLSPEALFSKLPNRSSSHGYLRGPQVDALREYETIKDKKDIAFELPTGTGKTTVGLLIAEWRRRRSGEKVAYLTLTNQLAKQVLREAENLGIDCADLIGNKDTRNPAEVGRYKVAAAIGVTTYSNLFNVNPVLQASDMLIFDDAHGGEQFVSEMWTVRINRRTHQAIYEEAITALGPSLTESQFRIITDETEYRSIELAEVHPYPEVSLNITTLLDQTKDAEIYYPWSLIRNQLPACLFFISVKEIVIRPLVPPTHTHASFSETKQRIYMSATLGGEGDLQRGYGVINIETIRARHAQWGKRYIFIPGLHLEEAECSQLISDVWNRMDPARALLLAPSTSTIEKTYKSISKGMTEPIRLGPRDIEESLDAFISREFTLLCLAGRYDGLDLPGDDCRFLIMAESPAAVGALEHHLREHWRLGPLLRRRERTRLIQGMGRCTRDATDFAVIVLLGQSLINSITTSSIVQGLPSEIQRELKWGIEQGGVAKENVNDLTEMIIGLLNDAIYRKEANESLEEIEISEVTNNSDSYQETGKLEVQYSAALWAGDFSRAQEVARNAADLTNDPELSGYRAWWWYLAALAAHNLTDTPREIDCLKRARSTGINTGFLDCLLRARNKQAAMEEPIDVSDVQAEAIWNQLEQWGWQGPNFSSKLKEMIQGLNTPAEPTQFHIGVERLGQCLGAYVLRPTGEGVPDIVWIFHDRSFTIESKSNKEPGSSLYKKDILNAKAHPDWLRTHLPDLSESEIRPIIVSPTKKVDNIAAPYIQGLNYLSTEALKQFADNISSELTKIRAKFAGKDYGSSRSELKAMIQQARFDLNSINILLSEILN